MANRLDEFEREVVQPLAKDELGGRVEAAAALRRLVRDGRGRHDGSPG